RDRLARSITRTPADRLEDAPDADLALVDDPRVIPAALVLAVHDDRSQRDADAVRADARGLEHRREQEREVLAVAAAGGERLRGEQPLIDAPALGAVRERADVLGDLARSVVQRPGRARGEPRAGRGVEADRELIERAEDHGV